MAKQRINVGFMEDVYAGESFRRNISSLNRLIPSKEILAAGLDSVTRKAVPLSVTLTPEESDQLTDVYNKVVEDGRYVGEFSQSPADVATRLGLTLSKSGSKAVLEAAKIKGAKDLILTGGVRTPGGEKMNAVAVVAVAVVVVAVQVKRPGPDDHRIIVESSGQLRL